MKRLILLLSALFLSTVACAAGESKVLMIFSNGAPMGGTTAKNNLWEYAEPHHVFVMHGYIVDFVSPHGGQVPFSLDADESDPPGMVSYTIKYEGFRKKADRTLKPEQVRADAYVAVFVGGGAGSLFEDLLEQVPWQAERRQMYERVVDVPRLLCFYGEEDPLPHPRLVMAREALNAHYARELGELFTTAGLCLYRDGRDSVAWHGDTIGRGKTTDTMVAIVSLGDPRRLHLRPRLGGADPVTIEMGHGDLVVMGGSCQRTWEHAVPKVAQAGPRISVQYRPLNVF